MPPYRSAQLAEMLRRPAAHLLSAEAAVELLIDHGTWLARDDFVDRYIRVADPAYAGSAPVAVVRWKTAVNAIRAGRLVCSGNEAAMLRIAASIAEGIAVDLRDAVSGLDGTNLGLALEALAHANGRPVQIAAR